MAKPKKTEPTTEIETPAAVSAMMAINPVFAKAWMDMMSESARFMTERLRRDMELQQNLLSCKDPAELMKVQSDFMREAMAQYADEASRYYKLMFKSFEDIEDDVRHGHKRGYDDVPL
ncbi:MAG: phasin family protein [Pseudomonadota bacterium]